MAYDDLNGWQPGFTEVVAIVPGRGVQRVLVAKSAYELEKEEQGQLTIGDACKILGASRNGVQALVNQGVIRAGTVRGVTYLDAEDVFDLARGRSPSARHAALEAEHRATWSAMFGGTGSSSVTSERDPAPVDAGLDFMKRYGEGV